MPTPEQTLQNLARLDPDYPAFEAQSPKLLNVTEPLPDGLAADILNLLRIERPELSKWLDMQPPNSPPAKFFTGSAAETGLLVAALFLLRTHIKVEGTNFLFEHKPMDNDLLKKILDTLRDFWGNKFKT